MAIQTKKRLRKGKDKVVYVVNDLRKELEGDLPDKVLAKIGQARDLLIEGINKLAEAIHDVDGQEYEFERNELSKVPSHKLKEDDD